MSPDMDRRLFTAGLTMATVPAIAVAQPSASEDEDKRLSEFFVKAESERLLLSPEEMTYRGQKNRYDELGNYTEAGRQQWLNVAERQVEQMKRNFDPAKLSYGARISFDLFDWSLIGKRLQVRWYWHSYAVSANGSSLDGIAMMLISQHRVDTVSDAEAYVSRLCAFERIASEVSTELDSRTLRGLLPPAFVFDRVIPQSESQLKGYPFDEGADHVVWDDFKKKVGSLPSDEGTKARLLSEGHDALKGEWARGYTRYISALKSMAKKKLPETTGSGLCRRVKHFMRIC